jgi:hypothetical protein
MSRTLTTTDEITIEVPVDVVYARVSDVTAMGQWSPENTGGSIVGPDRVPFVGMVFDGHNKRGRLTWTSRCEVTVAEPNVGFAFTPREFVFRGPRLKFPIPTTWRYDFRALDDRSTVVTETWAIGPWPALLILLMRRFNADSINVVEMQRRNIRITLQNLKSRLEAEQDAVSVPIGPSSGASRQ